MPLGQAKLPDAEIALIREWIQAGLLETAMSLPKGPVGPSTEYHRSEMNQPAVMPEGIAALGLKEPARAHPVTALAASPWAPVAAIAGHERVYLYDLATRRPAGELAFPEGVPYALRFSREYERQCAENTRDYRRHPRRERAQRKMFVHRFHVEHR